MANSLPNSHHLADVLCMPPPVIAMLQQGSFVISISGAHEMLINKACKTAIVRPSKDPAINDHSLLTVGCSNRGLVNSFSKKQASSNQSNDLLNFRSIGQK